MSTCKKRFGIFREITRNISPRELSKSFDTTIFQYPIDVHCPKSPDNPEFPDDPQIPKHFLPSFLSKPEKPDIFPINLKLTPKPQKNLQNFQKVDQKISPDIYRNLLTPSPAIRLQNYNNDSSLNSSGNFSNASFNMKISTEDSSREEIDKRRKPKKRPLEENEKNFYVIRLDYILNRKDLRTTVMIKNIPNKYTQKMLLHAIDKKFIGTYDFLYLPIDFKNKCNVGYAFINFVNCSVIVEFFREFNGKRWEKFNSEKVCALAYGRIQGFIELVEHFQNSSVINQEDNKVKPVILAKV